MFKNVSYFVTIKNDQNETFIRKLKVERQAQLKLTPLFTEGAKKLLGLEKINFDGSYKPDIGEVHQISNFPVPPEILLAIKEPSSVEDLDLNTETPPRIISVFTGNFDPSIVAFQRFNFSQFITNKGVSLFNSNDTFQLIKGFGLNIQERVDCLFIHGNLLFESFHTARQIFDLAAYYREATDSDVTEFMENPSLFVEDKEHFYSQSDTWVRRKIALINDAKALEKFTAAQICEKAASYGLTFEKKKVGKQEKIVLPKDKREMKDALRFLDEEIYKGPLSETTYLTNSKRKYS